MDAPGPAAPEPRVLAGGAAAELADAFRREVLESLPRPEDFGDAQARRAVVLLGLGGASIARHHQEADPARKARPEESFGPLRAGPDGVPFVEYFTRLAQVTGTGHPARDSYASLVRWNAPTTLVELDGAVLAELPGVFPDARIRTYTDDPGEVTFFELLKKSEALEAAVNRALDPMADGLVDPLSPEGAERALDATRGMYALIGFNRDFAARDPAHGGLRTEHFMDVFRQFAVHWAAGDVPPTGAQDPEFLRRDFLLGIDFPDYGRHVRRVFPGLLAEERAALERDMLREPLPAPCCARSARTRRPRPAYGRSDAGAAAGIPGAGRVVHAARGERRVRRRAPAADREVPVQAAAGAGRGGDRGPGAGLEPARDDGHGGAAAGAAGAGAARAPAAGGRDAAGAGGGRPYAGWDPRQLDTCGCPPCASPARAR